MKKLLISLSLILIFANTAFGQFSATGGTSVFNNFGIGRNLYGIDLGMEYSESDEQSIWGRISLYPAIRNKQLDSIFLEPYDINQNFKASYIRTRTSYYQFSGGSRFYAGDGYDIGIGAYGGYKFSLILANIKNELDEYDETVYKDPQAFSQNSKILTLTVGLNGGIKYSFPNVGSVFLEGNLDYGILVQASNGSYIYSEYYRSPLFLSLNIGFRKALNF
ncbi:MAG: hypothetical protein KJ941_03420 [Bacteroidetes bacterium]|nr:hypothetical protein [Bacteroidota bacterium]